MSNDPDVIKIDNLYMANSASNTALLENKSPFLIGVAGGTASGKVIRI